MYPCPCCGYLVHEEPPGSFEICPICFWEDDNVQLRYAGISIGANHVSLMEAQQNFISFGACEERIKEYVRPPNAEDIREPGWRVLDLAIDHIEDRSRDHPKWPDDMCTLYYWRPTYRPK